MKNWRTRVTSWAVLALLTSLALLLIFLLFGTARDPESGILAKILLAVILALALMAAWITKPDDLGTGSAFERSLLAKRAAFLILAMLAAFSIANDIGTNLNQLFPGKDGARPPADLPQEVAVKPATAEARQTILRQIEGSWGEQDCRVAFRFSIQGSALVIESSNRPAGEAPYRSVATIVSVEGNTIETRSEDFRAAIFTYRTNGVVEHLTWDDGRDVPPSRYRRCGGTR